MSKKPQKINKYPKKQSPKKFPRYKNPKFTPKHLETFEKIWDQILIQDNLKKNLKKKYFHETISVNCDQKICHPV